MEVITRLYEGLAERAAQVNVAALTIGLGYTAVATDDGGLGLAYTMLGERRGCSFERGWNEAEGAPALALLELLHGEQGLERSIGVATANALSYPSAAGLPTDDGSPNAVVRALGLHRGSRVAMVGFMPPVAESLRAIGAELEVIDEARQMGDQRAFGERLAGWADALIMTSTTLLNDTAEDLLTSAGSSVRAAFLGPTTPLVPEAYAHLPVAVLAGTVPVDTEAVLRAVRHGAGARLIQRSSRKVYCLCGEAAAQGAA